MKYIMLQITDNEDYDIHEDVVCSTLKGMQETMEQYFRLEERNPKFMIEEGTFRDGVLRSSSCWLIGTSYVERNGITVPVLKEVKRNLLNISYSTN